MKTHAFAQIPNVDEAKGLVQTSVLKNVKDALESVFLETSRRLASDLPQSAMNNLRGVHRYHEARGITMASTKLASKVLKGLMCSYVSRNLREAQRRRVGLAREGNLHGVRGLDRRRSSGDSRHH